MMVSWSESDGEYKGDGGTTRKLHRCQVFGEKYLKDRGRNENDKIE